MDFKPQIKRSHERCIAMGIQREMVYSRNIICGEKLQQKLEHNKGIIINAMPFMNDIYNFVKGSNFFVVLTDKCGCILNMIGDEDILGEAYGFNMIPGAHMDEESIGTNAMAMALLEGRGVQVSGEEHYISAYHRWTCSAAPIRDANGEICAVIDLTGYSSQVHPHTLGMVVACVSAVEKMLQSSEYIRTIKFERDKMQEIFKSVDCGIFTVDSQSNIIEFNQNSIELFGYSKEELSGRFAGDIFSEWCDIEKAVFIDRKEYESDAYINAISNRQRIYVQAKPVFGHERQVTHALLIMNDKKLSRKHDGDIKRGRAVYEFEKIIGKDPKFTKNVEYAKKISGSKSTILITGESGTGKEVFAQSIHNYSGRSSERFVAVNCGAIPESLIESELFGYEEGAFTGAKKGGMPGKFETANKGTMFLDEIGEMPLDMQVRLLRVIEEGVVNRIGGQMQIPVDIRVIAATNKDLDEEMKQGRFRKDLYYRLNVLPIRLLPLRERKEDIPLLVEYFMENISNKLNKKPVEIPGGYMEHIMECDWLGNIRELENFIEMVINMECLPEIEMGEIAQNYEEPETGEVLDLGSIEKGHIIKMLKMYNKNITRAAKAMGIARNTLYRKIEKHGIEIDMQ